MMNAKMAERFELAFWDTVVLLLTRSPFVLSIARAVYQIFCEDERKNALTMGLIASAAGLCFGALLFGISIFLL